MGVRRAKGKRQEKKSEAERDFRWERKYLGKIWECRRRNRKREEKEKVGKKGEGGEEVRGKESLTWAMRVDPV